MIRSDQNSKGGRPKEIITTSLKAFETLMTIEHEGNRDMILECRRMLSGTSEKAAVEVINIVEGWFLTNSNIKI